MVQAWVALLGSVLALATGLVQGRLMAQEKAKAQALALEEWALALDQDLAEAQERALVQARQLEASQGQVQELARLLVAAQGEQAGEKVQGSARAEALEKELVLVQDSLERKVQELESEKARLMSRVSELEMALDSARAKAMLH